VVENSCVSCRVVRGHTRATILHRNEEVEAFHASNPVAPTRILIIPVRHIVSLMELQEGNGQLLWQLFSTARKLAVREGLHETIIGWL
jgi:histidine triad (HIT) family protein